MTLTEEQKTQVGGWIAAGLKLSEIQKRLDTELGVRLTYMEVRFLMDDLKLVPKDPEPPKLATPPPSQVPSAPTSPADAQNANDTELLPEEAEPELPPDLGGNVKVNVDKITRPGALVSGNVTFSDGQSAVWYLDQMGRLGLAPQQKGYKPSPADVQSFQVALQSELARLGF